MKINYTINSNNIITGYTIIPFNENLPTLELTEEEVSKIKCGYTQLTDDHQLIYNTDVYQTTINTRKELQTIQKWFIDNDWKVNKIVIGEWKTTDSRWLDYLTERTIKRARQDELNKLLNK